MIGFMCCRSFRKGDMDGKDNIYIPAMMAGNVVGEGVCLGGMDVAWK